jgi:hypothetical protein
LPLGIAICDIPTRSGPSIRETRVRRFRGVRVWSIGDFKGKKPSQFGIAIREIPTGELCGPQVELVEDRCQTSGKSQKSRQIGFPEDKELETFQAPNPGGN